MTLSPLAPVHCRSCATTEDPNEYGNRPRGVALAHGIGEHGLWLSCSLCTAAMPEQHCSNAKGCPRRQSSYDTAVSAGRMKDPGWLRNHPGR
eukprot:7133282-Prymnesium_polylepis.1